MHKITAEELALSLNCHNLEEGFTKYIINLARNSNLVIVSAIGDDTIVFSGALKDEFDLLHGGQIFLDKEDNECTSYTRQNVDKTRKKIEVLWDKHSYCKWKFITLIKHSTYNLNRGGKGFCKGFIFSTDSI